MKISKDEAFAAAFELKAAIRQKQKQLTTFTAQFPADRMPADVRSNTQQWTREIALLTPVLDFLEERAGREAPTL